MTLECRSDGSHVTLTCDLCGLQARRLKKVTGHWKDRKTGRKGRRQVMWLCPACRTKIGRT